MVLVLTAPPPPPLDAASSPASRGEPGCWRRRWGFDCLPVLVGGCEMMLASCACCHNNGLAKIWSLFEQLGSNESRALIFSG